MKHFDLFSGYGGFSIACERNGIETIGFSEIDKYASAVLKYHYPNTTNYGDITRIDWRQVPDFDLLTGGSPCQDFSIAGKRRGLAGSRSSLAWEFIRGLRDKKPKYFIWENVKGVMSSRGGWDFGNILTAFSESGYSLWWQVLNAKDFGVPQNRERIFVVGFRDESPKEVFFEPKDSGQIEIVGTTKPKGSTRIGQRDRTFSENGIIHSLEASGFKQPPQILVSKSKYNTNDSRPEIGQANRVYKDGLIPPLNNWSPKIEVINKGESQHYRLYDENGLAPTLQSQSGMSSQKHPFIVAQRGRNPKNPKSRKSGLKTEQTLEANLTGNSNTLTGVEKDNYVFDGQVRKLMPIECERLMGLPDNWTSKGIINGKEVEISDSQRYKLCGNGVVVNVVEEIIDLLLNKKL